MMISCTSQLSLTAPLWDGFQVKYSYQGVWLVSHIALQCPMGFTSAFWALQAASWLTAGTEMLAHIATLDIYFETWGTLQLLHFNFPHFFILWCQQWHQFLDFHPRNFIHLLISVDFCIHFLLLNAGSWSDLHFGTSMGFKLPNRSLTYRLSPSSRLSQLLQAKQKRRWGRLISVTTTLSRNQLAFIPVLSCSILGGQCNISCWRGIKKRDERERKKIASRVTQIHPPTLVFLEPGLR